MGTGKTAVGEALAKKRKWRFLDLDELIELRERRAIADIFAQEGEPYFRRVEKRTLKEVSQEKKFVVACGGGIVIDPGNIKIMRETGKIICLTATADIILKRTRGFTHRPLLNVANPKEKIELLQKQRLPFYAGADKTINTSRMSVKEVVNKIAKILFLSLGICCWLKFSFAQTSALNPADGYFNQGILHKNKGELLQALADYDEAIELDPGYAKAYNNRGNIYLFQGQFDKASADFNKAIELDPADGRTYANRGLVYAQENKMPEAISDFTKALEINSRLTEVYNNRGLAYMYQGKNIEAISDFNRAIAQEARYGDPYYNRGLSYLSMGNLEQAISDFNVSIEIDPNFSDGYNSRGLAYTYRGDLKQSVADYSKAIEINPNYLEAYNNRAVDYFFRRQYALAWNDVHKLEELKYNLNPEFLKDLQKASKRKKQS